MHLLQALLLNAGCISWALASPFTLTNSLPREFQTIPLADTSIDRHALANLAPSRQINLKYHDSSDPAGSLTLNIAADLFNPAIILENSIFIEQVHCSPSYDAVSFNITDSAARTQFIRALSRSKNGAALITKSKTCNSDTERGFFLQNGPVKTIPSGAGIITVPVLRKDLNAISKKLDVTYDYVPEEPAQNSDLRRRASPAQSPCKLKTGPSVASLQCNATGNLKSPTKTKFQTVNDFDSCMQLCEKDASCMSFGWAKGLPAGQSCWTSVVSLTKQKFVQNKSSPWLLNDQGCYACSLPTTSSTKTTSTKTTSTSKSTIATTSTTTTRVSSSTQSTTASSTSKSTSSKFTTLSPSQSSSTSTSKATSLSSTQNAVVSSTTTTSPSTTTSSSTTTPSSITTTSLPPLPTAGNGWQTDSNLLPPASDIPLVYDSQAAVSSYTKLLKNLIYSSGTAQGSYVPPASATPPAFTFNPNDAAAQASIASQLMSIGLQGVDAALSSVAAQATFAPPNIPANSPAPGQDELGGNSILPTDFPGSGASRKRSIAERSVKQAPAPLILAAGPNPSTNGSNVRRSIKQAAAPKLVAKAFPESGPSIERSIVQRSVRQAHPHKLFVRDGGDDFCDGVEVADDVCDALEGLEQPAIEIGCGVVGIANFGCEIRESWDALKCLFGGSCPGPAPPPPPIALSYAPKATQFSWSQPVNTAMWTDGVATIYCAQCSLDISNLGFSGTITIDPVSKGILAGNIVMSEASQRWLVLGLTTTGRSSGQKTFYLSTPSISTISVGSIFSITPSFQASFGLQWNVQHKYTDMQSAGAQIGQFGSQIYSDFYTKATQDQGEAKPGLRTFRPGLKPGDWMQTYAGTSASIDYKTAGQTLPAYVNTYIEYAIRFNAQSSTTCGSQTTGIAKQAYIMLNEDTYIGGTHSNLFSVSKQLADQCGTIGAASDAPDGCGNEGAQYALFDMNKIAGSSIGNLYTIVPSETGVINFIGGFDSSVSGSVSQGQSQGTTMSLSSYGNGAGFPYYQRIIVTQGYMYAPVTGTYTFTLNSNDYDGNYKPWLFWGPPGDNGINNFQASAYISIDAPEQFQTSFSQTSSLYMTAGNYYAYRMILQLVQAYRTGSFSHHWQVNYPNGTTWLDSNNHGDHNLVQYSCDQTTAAPFPEWAESY